MSLQGPQLHDSESATVILQGPQLHDSEFANASLQSQMGAPWDRRVDVGIRYPFDCYFQDWTFGNKVSEALSVVHASVV